MSPSSPAPSQSVNQGSANPRIDTDEQTPAPQNPSVGDGQTPAPGTQTPAPQSPTTQAPAPQNPSVDGGQTPAPQNPATQTPEQTRRDTLAATGASGVWVGVGAVAVLVAGIGAVVASRRAKR